MKKHSFAALLFFAAAAVACLCTTQASAWQRSAMNDCKKASKNCKKSKDQCKQDYTQCQQEAAEHDEDSFEDELSPYAKSIFMKFSDERKTRAMDYADRNKMTPDDAVAKEAGECMCTH